MPISSLSLMSGRMTLEKNEEEACSKFSTTLEKVSLRSFPRGTFQVLALRANCDGRGKAANGNASWVDERGGNGRRWWSCQLIDHVTDLYLYIHTSYIRTASGMYVCGGFYARGRLKGQTWQQHSLLRAIGQTNWRGRIFGIFSTLVSFEHKVGKT